MKQQTKLGKDFGPAAQLKSYYYLCAVVLFALIILPWYLPLLVFAPADVMIIISLFVVLPIFLVFLFTLYWIPKYYNSVIYRLTDREMTWRRGVWFRNTGIVPYNRITNIDISQGPVSRKFGIGSIKMQTAGYSAAVHKSVEISMDGIVDFEELRETIMKFVRGRAVAAETYDEDKILSEIVKIRKLMEKRG
jgi:membrane protein YdbS with pleckstrin-like domain